MGLLLETRFFNLLVKSSQTPVSSDELKNAFDDLSRPTIPLHKKRTYEKRR